MKKHINKLWLVLLVSSLSSCIEEHYLKFDSTFTGIYFTTDSTNYSFSVTPVEVREHLLKIPVQIMGAPVAEERDIKYELVEQAATTDGVHYVVDKAVIPADSITGYIGIRILRDNLEGNSIDGYERYKVYLRLLPNEYFTPTLDSLRQNHQVRFDKAVEQPEWLNSAGEKVWLKGSLGTWHPYKLIKMVEYFHAIKDVQPLTYEKMVILYGENLEHIPEGNPMQYETIFKRYIYKPMYDHFNDPANKDMILSMYPDFPFDDSGAADFPNPYPNA